MLKELFNPSNYFFNPYAVPSLVASIYCIALGTFVWAKNKKLLGFSVFSFTFPCGMWLLLAALAALSKRMEVAYIWDKLIFFWVCFISPGSLFIGLCLTKMIELKKERMILLLGYIVMTVFSFITIFTNWIVEMPPNKFFWGFDTNAGKYYLFFLSIWSIWGLKATYNMYITCRKVTTSIEKSKFRIFLFAYLFGYLSTVDYLSDIGIGIYPCGYFFMGIGISLISYNMIRYKAFEVETVIHKTLLWAISIATLVIPVGIASAFIFNFFIDKSNIYLEIAIFIIFFISFYYYYSYLRPRIDHVFRRKKYDYLQVLGTIAREISGIIHLDELSQKTITSIKGTLYLQTIHLFLKDEKKKGYYLKAKMEKQYTSFNKESSPLFVPERGGIVSLLERMRQPLEKELINIDPSYEDIKEEAEDLFDETDSIILFGLFMENELVGLLFLGKRENLQYYTKMDITALNNLALEIGNFFFTALHHQDVLERQRLQQEIILAKNIQENLLPQKPPHIPGISLFGLYVPSKEIGGDYYDFIQAEDRKQVHIAIGDVSGKGLDAGLVVTSAKSYLSAFIKYNTALKEILNILNKELFVSIGQQKFISLLLLRYLANQNTITYSAAGHECILLYKVSSPPSEIEIIKSGGIVLGMLDDIESYLEENTLTLNKGDKIILYTDGVTEARNPQEELFSLARLVESFKRHAHHSISDIIHNIHEDIKDFISTREQYDDITLVGIEKE